ncbi:hydrolase [Microdochium bolleyi]|uniref:Hydrolase n=1 Tax=Microdochium bolleyi TaxID=196109 RepID=A0A136IND8_9PEZI|nr:hydrolase [Microdochium bolleyi]
MPEPVQVAYKRVKLPKVGENGYVGFQPGKSEVIKAGTKPFGHKALTSDIQIDHDVEVVVRDGCRLYMDVYRPAGSTEKVPAILSWSPYGKKYSALDMLPMCVWHCCVQRDSLSGMEKFEGLDPALWCPKGYAIISVDTRGTGHSDGQIPIMGPQDAEDGYDVVEAVAKMDWCNGNVGMAGNSALAISQWFIASEQPPSLKAIAPWEGMGDMYREQFCRGGWFSMSNFDLITSEIIRGQENSGVEDWAEMYRRSPTQNDYWKAKRVDMTKIKCAAYIRGSDVSAIHTMGCIRAWLEIPHDNKWIHWSSKQEWFELYQEPHAQEELAVFFDRFLREQQNSWDKTPKCRWSALQYGDREPIDDIVIEDFPVPGTEYRELFFQPGGKLATTKPAEATSVTYNSEDYREFAEFRYTFEQDSRIIGLPKAIVHVSCDSRDDFTIFTIIRKHDKDGKVLMHLNMPFDATPVKSIDEIPAKEQATINLHQGAMGILRASQRAIDETKSIHPQFPFHPHEKQEKITPGTVVRLEIGIWAMGVDFDAGESVSIRVGGQYPSIAEYKTFSAPRPEHELNRGTHKIHFGGEYPSSVILPFTPFKK